MPSDIGHHRPPPLITVSGAIVSYIHTLLGFAAFGSALIVALYLHYHKVVKNGIAGWPQEYWPSVSATIGDWYPERNLFQIGIALMSGPRFMLVFLSSLLVSLSKPTSPHAIILFIVGTLRTIAAGLFIFITSSDDHDMHDIAMGLYLVLTPPWMYITSGSLAAQPNKETMMATSSKNLLANQARRMRRFAATAFFGMMPFMVIFFYRHKVLEIPGAYTHYAFFEWGLVIFDLLFDCASTYDLSRLEIHIVEAKIPFEGKASNEQRSSLVGGKWIEGGTTAAVSSGAWSTSPQVTTFGKSQAGEKIKNGSVLKSKQELKEPNFLFDLLNFAAESYFAFAFWTNLTALHPAIFFFSVYNMGVGGHEALLVVQVLTLGVAMIPSIRRLILETSQGKLSKTTIASSSSQIGQIRLSTMVILHILCLAGMSIWLANDQLIRLLATATSCVGFTLLYTLEWGRAWECGQLDRKASTWLVGLLLSSVAKYSNHSNNPAWPILNSTNGGANLVALILLLGSTFIRIVSHQQAHQAKSPPFTTRSQTSLINTIVGFSSLGALIFILHVLLSDSGSMIAWTWTGYPIRGPMAIPHGYSILLASSISLFASLQYPTMSLHPIFWMLGPISMAVLFAFEDWIGFVGALGLAIFLPPLARPLLQVGLQGDPIKMLFGAWLVADLLAFFQVLTVAYAFIPGGMIMRERTGLMMTITMIMILGGLIAARKQYSANRGPVVSPRLKIFTFLPVALITIVAVCISSLRQVSPTEIRPYHPESRVITTGIWTVHFSLDQGLWDSTRRMSELIKDMKLDVVGLLETDLHRTVFGNRDLTQYLSESLGMYADIGPGPDKHTWGAVLLSKFPIINSTHHLLPSPHGELAPAIHAVLDIYGILTHVTVSHNGQEEDPLDRQLQTEKLAEIAREAYPHPFIFLGYVVTRPHARRPNPYEILFTDGRLIDVDPKDTNRWCQYIGFRALERVGYVRVSRFTVTDTELQTAKFRIPRLGDEPIDPDRDVLPNRIPQVPTEDWAYPTKFIDPPAMVYNKHKYSPHFYPLYYGA